MSDTFDPSTQQDDDVLPPDAAIASVAALAARQRAAETRVIDLTAALQAALAEYRQVAEVDLPRALGALGVGGFPLADGTKVEVLTALDSGQLTAPEGLAWVEANGGASLIKTSIHIELDRGDLEEAKLLFERLRGDPLANRFRGFALTESVHPQTLASFVRQLIEQRKDPPLDKLGVHRRTYAVVGRRPKRVDLKGFARR